MNAASIAHALGGRKSGGGWTARCPAHDDRTPSPSSCDADDGNVLVRETLLLLSAAGRAICWIEDELIAWQRQRLAKRDGGDR
jgi:hypothetical protein